MKSLYSNKNGDFEFLTVNPIEVIEVQFIGKLTLKIIEIGVWHEETKDFKKRQLSIHQIYRFN